MDSFVQTVWFRHGHAVGVWSLVFAAKVTQPSVEAVSLSILEAVAFINVALSVEQGVHDRSPLVVEELNRQQQSSQFAFSTHHRRSGLMNKTM